MARRGKVVRLPKRPPETPDERGLAAVHRCTGSEAAVVRGLFESEGIPSLLRSRLAHSVHPFTIGDQGEVVILVPRSEEARARRLLVRLAP